MGSVDWLGLREQMRRALAEALECQNVGCLFGGPVMQSVHMGSYGYIALALLAAVLGGSAHSVIK